MIVKIKEYLKNNGFILVDTPSELEAIQKGFHIVDMNSTIDLSFPQCDTFMLSTQPFHYAEIVSLLEKEEDFGLDILNYPNFKSLCSPAFGLFACNIQ